MMGPTAPAVFAPEAFGRWGQWLIATFFTLCTLFVLSMAWLKPAYIPVLPAALIGVPVALFLFRYPRLNLYVVLLGFITIMDHKAGLQVGEVVYGLYQYAFLAHWFVLRLLLDRRPVLRDPEDKALFVFLVLITLSIPLTFLMGGTFRDFFNEFTALVVLAFYFPIKEACMQYRDGTRDVLIILTILCLFVAFRNFADYYSGIASAKYIWQIMRGRVITNDHIPMLASVMALTFLVYAERLTARVILLGIFLVFSASLVLTLSRGYWVAFMIGAIVVFCFVGWRQQSRLLVLGTLGFGGLVILGILFFGGIIELIFSGLLTRFTSIGSATTTDLSLMSRFAEAKGVLAKLSANPILGHGMGVEYRYFDIISHTTVDRLFIHNGYLSLWYRFGIWGLGLVLFFWGKTIWRGFQVFTIPGARSMLRLTGLACSAVLIAFVFSTFTSNPFYLSDSLIVFAFLPALSSGSFRRAQLEAIASDQER